MKAFLLDTLRSIGDLMVTLQRRRLRLRIQVDYHRDSIINFLLSFNVHFRAPWLFLVQWNVPLAGKNETQARLGQRRTGAASTR